MSETTPSSSLLQVQKHRSHWILNLDKAHKRNALCSDLVETLLKTLDAAEAAQINLLVLKGEGKNFSAGFDFSGYEEQSEGDLVLRFIRLETLLQRLTYSTCATLALVHGSNFGAGVDLIASCTYRISSANGRFRMPGLKFGLVLGTRRLAHLIGAEQARELLETTALFDAAKALNIGFIQQITEIENWEQQIQLCLEKNQALSYSSRIALQQQLHSHHTPEADLAALVHSASEPGLKARIKQFRAE